MMKFNQQVLPGFYINPEASFDNFYTNDALLLVKNTLVELLKAKQASAIYICGVNGTGKSHLLQALCNSAHSSMYLPLNELSHFSAEDVLDNMNDIDVLCIDDIEKIAVNAAWEEQLFHLYNRRMALAKITVFSANTVALDLPLILPDLRTRLSACINFQLPLLQDQEKMALLQYKAEKLGMNINEVCAQYIIHRSNRDLTLLLDIVATLDKASLEQGRKITVPFIKEIMQW